MAEVKYGLSGHSSKATHCSAPSFYCFLKTCLSIQFLDEFPQMGNKNNKTRRLEKATHTFFFFFFLAALKYLAVDQCGINHSQVSTPDCPALAGQGNICFPDNEHHFGSGAMIWSSLTFCCVSGGWQLMQMEFSITAFYEEGNLLFTKEYQPDFSKATFFIFYYIEYFVAKLKSSHLNIVWSENSD